MFKMFFLNLLIFMNVSSSAFAWEEVIADHLGNTDDRARLLINEQFTSYKSSFVPTIATDVIREIPIRENGEDLVDIAQLSNPRIVMMPGDQTGEKVFSSPNCNAGFVYSSKVRRGVYNGLVVMLKECDKISKSYGIPRGSVVIKVFEGLRTIDAQKTLFANKVQELREKDPSALVTVLKMEASKWISPVEDNIPAHSTGGAVDIRLWNSVQEEFIDMGLFGAIWGNNPGIETFSDQITKQQKINRLFLLHAATAAGFVNYPYEFWHFSLGDRYAAYWNKQIDNREDAYATYGIVNHFLDPAQ